MPLPSLKPRPAQDVAGAAAREYRKRILLGEPPEQAAHAAGGPVAVLEQHPAGQALVRAIPDTEQLLLRETAAVAPRMARAALESRDGRTAWLAGVMTGEIKFEGAFGNMKEFPPAAKIAAARLLGLMHGDYVTRHEVSVDQHAVLTFRIPDNGALPAEQIVDMPAETPE